MAKIFYTSSNWSDFPQTPVTFSMPQTSLRTNNETEYTGSIDSGAGTIRMSGYDKYVDLSYNQNDGKHILEAFCEIK